MPWYYASPEGQPLGPFSPEELVAKRAAGVITPSTYILDQGADAAPVWRRYQEVFPISALPPVPSGEIPLPPPLSAIHPYHRPTLVKTNTWAVLGCILGIMSLVLSPVCCIGSILAFPGLLFSVLGYYEIERNQPYETGKGVALAGVITSALAVLLLIGVIFWAFHAQKDFTYSFQHILPPLPNSIH